MKSIIKMVTALSVFFLASLHSMTNFNAQDVIAAINAGDVARVQQYLRSGLNPNLILNPNMGFDIAPLDIAWAAAADDYQNNQTVSPEHIQIYTLIKKAGGTKHATYGETGPIGQRSAQAKIREILEIPEKG